MINNITNYKNKFKRTKKFNNITKIFSNVNDLGD